MSGLSRRALPVLVTSVVAVVAVTVAGCSSPLTTTKDYAPSDGVRVVLGSSFSGANLLIITAGEGEPGVLVGGLTNSTDKATTVSELPFIKDVRSGKCLYAC